MHYHPPKDPEQEQVAGDSLKVGAGSAEVGIAECSHLPHSRDTLDQHPSVKLSSALSAQKMPSPTAAVVLAHRSQPFAAALDVARFQSEH
jgi:hypothetical protein